MATKNLSRTVIEGGRYHGNTFDRRASHGPERGGVRQALRAIRDGDDADGVVLPKKRKVQRHFHDKLAAAERWLRAQIGRPWNKVRAELFACFDTRTTAGRHIVFDHMLPWVRVDRAVDSWSWRYHILEVGRGGILRLARERPRQRREHYWPRAEWLAWLAGRKVAIRGEALFWLEPTEIEQRFRQGRRLDDEERAYFLALPSAFHKEHGRVM